MCGVKGDLVKRMIDQIKEEIEEVKEKNKNLITGLGLKKLLEELNRSYLRERGSIFKPNRQIYVKNFDKEKPLIIDFISLYLAPRIFFIATSNGKHVYVTNAHASVCENGGIKLLEDDLSSKKLTERENLASFEQNEMIGSYGRDDINETDLEEIRERIARIFFEAFLKDKVLFRTSGGASDGD